MKISHTADIHIRALSRHDEYRETFRNFIDDCRLQQVDHIFVGGDIFHTKTTGISPEYIDLLSWWLTEMAKVAPVHLILGNHDGNLTNMSRQDAVSPIIDALSNPRITLYKKSGVYQFAPGYNFCVYSLFDEEGWDKVRPVSGDFNIACYHGPVWGSKTESDWEVEDGLKVSFFNDYDITLLGDIHKRQTLAYKNHMPSMAYPGTLIQQGYAEDLDHGYLIWDIRSSNDWNVEYRTLPNTKPFITLEWAGDVDSTFDLASNFPTGSRFRIKSFSHIIQKDVQNLTSRLKLELCASEITFKIDQQISRETIVSESQVLHRNDLRESDALIGLMKNYHLSGGHSENKWNSVGEQLKSYLQIISASDEFSRNTKWSLKDLQFNNLFSYGEGNRIDFDSMSGITGIFGSNRAGKSSIVGSIMYSLFNTTDRGPMKNLHICNIRKPFCWSKATIGVDGVDYVIERQTTKSENKKGIVSAATALNLFKINSDGTTTDMAGEQRTNTEKIVRKLIGSPEDFLMTSLSAQGEINQFISHGSTRRRQILSKFLDLDVFDKLYELSSKDANVIKSQLKLFPDKDWNLLEEQNFKTLASITFSLEENTRLSTETNFLFSDLKTKLSQHGDFSLVTEDQVLSYKSATSKLEHQLLNTKSEKEKISSEILKLQEKIKTIDGLTEDNDIETLKKRFESFRQLESNLKELKQIHEKEATILKSQERSVKILDDIPCGDSFPTCKFIKDAYTIKGKIDSQQEKTIKALAKLNSANDSLQLLKGEDIQGKLDKLLKLQDMKNKLSLDVSSKNTQLVRLDNQIDLLDKEFLTSQKKLAELEEALRNDENAEVVSLRNQIDDVNKKIKKLESDKISFARDIGRLTSESEKLNEEKMTRQNLLHRLSVYELINNAFSKKGIPSFVVSSQMPVINSEISKILAGIVDFNIELEIDEESESMEVYINYGDSRRIIELASGMEKMISSIAIRVALINISSLPKTDMFIIDEGFGALDEAGVEACNRLLSSLKRYFKTLMVITHVDGIKDSADFILEISKNEKDSKVVFE